MQDLFSADDQLKANSFKSPSYALSGTVDLPKSTASQVNNRQM